MILFIDTEQTTKGLIPYEKISSLRIYEFSLKGKSLIDPKMLDKINSFLDILLYEEESLLCVINDLDDAFINLEELPEEESNLYINSFTRLVEELIGLGHDIIYYTGSRTSVNSEVLELNKQEGFTIVRDSVKLYNILSKGIK